MHIAIIGGGISGLSAAHWLAPHHVVTLFEANDYLGGHTHTVDVKLEEEHHAIDTGFIVFNDWTYPNFIALLEELGIESQPTQMGFSVRCDQTGWEYKGSSLNGLFAQRRNLFRPQFYRMIRDILRFNREAPGQVSGTNPASEDVLNDDVTVEEFLRQGGYSREFASHYLLPMGAAIWSCPVETFARFPIRFIVEFYRNHGLLNIRNRPTWRVITGGSRNYVSALARRFNGTIHLRTPIVQVRRWSDRVELTPGDAQPLRFDHVVFACHSDQAMRMLADASPVEREVLSEFPYERNVAVLHTDASILPRRRRAWASWNYRIPHHRKLFITDEIKDQPSKVSVTYCMNILQNIRSRHVFNVTLNGEDDIDPSRILGRYVYEHPIFTTRRASAQARHHELINV
ncbi:MAG: FAD-dependent oxidoreductase [Planctomycetota bacterium]|nr:FAD-dependent oxidoreductase [Planctomycetota bacterium]